MDDLTISKVECHDSLLDVWEKKFPTEKWHFNRDGIISPDHWERSDLKVLFILKETNKARQNVVNAITNALSSKKSCWWKGKVLRRVGRWAYGLANYSGEVPSFKDAKSFGKEAAWSIAYINMRKTAGGSRTNKKSFDAHVNEYAPYIKRQVELIKPDVIVLCGTFKPVKKHVFPEMEHVCKRVHKYNNMLLINAFHPAAIVKSAGIYHQVLDSYHNYKINYAGEKTCT
ncbi:hypothetical protein [Psychromonas aquimarina]|uniref:hypothetical protein n=1 Tax=Psychromonas aquimarina TaxID=444919 RepID=UPI0003F5A9D7|nr:hypothetical protein [Psychromonas aquimarina]